MRLSSRSRLTPPRLTAQFQFTLADKMSELY